MAKSYYFALGEVIKDLGISQAEARRRFGFNRKGPRYISKNGFSILCNRPDRITVRVFGIICHSMQMGPSEFWRVSQ